MRISNKDLASLCLMLNEAAGTPVHYSDTIDGVWRSCVGNYHISYAYGGCCLHQTVNEDGAVRDVLYTGYVSKRECYTAVRSYLAGFQDSLRNS